MKQSNFEVIGITDRVVYLEDLDQGGKSVTNDAERVYAWCQHHYPGKKVVYRDSEGEWAQMFMEQGISWVKFEPWHGEMWDVLNTKEII
jgi:hypothetical protein